jgi:2-aminoadipate transaminase
MTPRPPAGPRSARDLERYAALFSARTRTTKSSAMRDLMAIIAREEVISLAGGAPDLSAFPGEMLAKVTAEIAAEAAQRALQYGPTEGLDDVKDAIVEVMAAEGTTGIDPQDILVTTGGQQVIDLFCRTMVDPGDVVIAEAPTYPGAVPCFGSYEADVVQIEMDSDGMRVDELEETLDRLDREGRRPKFIYTIPTFHNPAGVTMSLPRRKRLVEVARERELLILEDNPYGLLRFEGEPLPTLHSLDGGAFVVYLGTFSKILAPGLRLGWAVAPQPVYQKLNIGKQAADLCSSAFSQLFVAHYFRTGAWPELVRAYREIYARRRDVMLAALDEFLGPQAAWTRPQGGMFVWATLPDYIDTTDLLARALEENVAFVPGRGAYLDGRGGSSMRLNFSYVSDEDLREGVRRIGRVVDEQVALYGTLTGQAPSGGGQARGEDRGEERADAMPEGMADVLHLPRRRAEERRAGGFE